MSTGELHERLYAPYGVAEKCGFQLEGTARGAFFNAGRSVDVLIYSLLRDDPRPWRKSD